MDINSVVNMLIPIVFSIVGIALVFFVLELIKVLKTVRGTLEDLQPKIDATMQNVQDLTTSIKPTLAKVDPMMDSLQLTVDAVNLEMMRVDEILEDITEITNSASSATAAVENITNAPVKAVNSVASRVRSAFGVRDASEEAVQLAEQRVAVAQALEDFKAAERRDAAKKAAAQKSDGEHKGLSGDTEEIAPVPEKAKSYVKETANKSELVIDPDVIAESPFFDGDSDER